MIEVCSETVAVVGRIPVAVGQEVTQGQVLAVLESMKIEIPVESPADGVVKEIRVAVGTPVEDGDPLVVIDPVSGLDKTKT